MFKADLYLANKRKFNEFYTLYENVEKELKHYKEQFENKIIYCNCDNPKYSNFWKYFHLNFSELKLKKLISTYYNEDEVVYKTEYVGGEDNNTEAGQKTRLLNNGDFRSSECQKIIDECDIVITNPPFSLFRDFIDIMYEHKKKFIVWGTVCCLGYKKTFSLFRDDKIRLGYHRGTGQLFEIPKNCLSKIVKKESIKQKDNKYFMEVPNIAIFTNLEVNLQLDFLQLTEKYSEGKYEKFDNYDAINIDRTKDIPCNYFGIMGVPISFLFKWNNEQFELVGFRRGIDGKDLVFTREREREFNRSQECLLEEDVTMQMLKAQNIEPIDYYFPSSTIRCGIIGGNGDVKDTVNGKCKFLRVLIRRKVGTEIM